MKTIVIVALIVLSAAVLVQEAAAQTPSPAQNQQDLPWFTRPQGKPGMPWFFRSPQCRVAYWYPAQFSHTDQWGNTVTWVTYAPHYVCGSSLTPQ